MDATFRIRLLFLLVLGFGIAACSDNGADGAQGPPGPPGAGGPPGPPGPPGSGGGVPINSAERINITVNSVTIPAGGGAPVVRFRLSNELNQGLVGLPGGDTRYALAQLTPGTNGGSSQWQNYISRTSVAARQGTTETGAAARFVDNNDGTYQYTFASALTAYTGAPAYDATKTHRLGIEIRNQAPATGNGVYDFVPAGGTPTFTRLIVDSDTCNACHDVFNFHGGGARIDIEYCVTCHNPPSIDGDTGNTVDMKRMIHNIHSKRPDYQIVGFGGTRYEWSGIHFPQDIRNCATCHEESDTDTPQASNFRLVANRAACGTCHYNDSIAGNLSPQTGRPLRDFAIENGVHPGGFTFTDDTQCESCHGPNGTVLGSNGRSVRVPVAHEILEDTAARAFEYQVVSVTNTAPGQIPTATIRVRNPQTGTNYDVGDPAGPFQTTSANLTVDIGWNNVDLGNLDPNNSLARSTTSGQPFAPIRIDFKNATGRTNDGTNTFTKSATVPIPTGIAGSGMALLEGRPQVTVNYTGTPVLRSLRVTSTGLHFGITDAAPGVDRRAVVDITKCNDCHNVLSIHGGSRTGNTELCSTCHNPNATDINRRVAGSACVNTLGADDQTIDLKRMIHKIHASGVDGSGRVGEPFPVCGFGNTPFLFEVGYPGRLNNCEGCHLANTYYPVDPARVLATTMDVGANRAILTDDVAISPNAAVCSSCHTDALQAEHMRQNGGDFAAGKTDTGALVSSGTETCQLCHGPGRSADVKIMHGVGTFRFN